MRHVLLVVVLTMAFNLWGQGSRAQEMREGDAASKAEIQRVIEAQIDAFKKDDGETAFGFATDSIRALFGTPERFLNMVRTSYGQIYRPRSVEFRRLLIVRGEPIQEVFFVGLDLTTMLALYRMERQADGSWRINGVLVADTAEQAT